MSTHALALAVAIATSPNIAAASQWQFVGNAADETAYFGRKIATEGDITVIKIKGVNDPDEPKPYEFTFVVNCATKQWQDSDRTWKPVPMEQVGGYWFKFACNK